MNCTNCGANLPPGAANCPNCGAATPYNTGVPGGSSPYDPTVASSQVPNSYGSTYYGGPPQNPYESSQQNPYGTPPQYPYDSSQQNPYAAPTQQNRFEAQAPSQYPYGAPPQPYYAPPPAPQPQRRKSRAGLIIGVIVLVLLLACIGIVALLALAAKNNSQANATPTPIATTAPTAIPTPQTGPSGLSAVPSAAAIITDPKMASAIDSNYYPTKFSNTFNIDQNIYVTFKLHLNGQTGYTTARWYGDNQYIFTSDILKLNDAGFDHGYFAAKYHIATQGAVELYWCTKSDCSDRQLADVVNFTVSGTSSSITGQPVVMVTDMDKRV